MSHRTLPSLVGLLVAVFVGGGLYWFAENVGLALATGVTWGGGVAIMLYTARRFPSLYTRDTGDNTRWLVLGTGLLTVPATVGIDSSLPLPFELRLGLQFLVIGTGVVGIAVATVAELERNTA